MIFLFEFFLSNGDVIFLTSASNLVKIHDRKYMPNSALSLENVEKVQFHIEATIKGFFEEGGIEKSTNLDNCRVKILQYDGEARDFLLLDFFEIDTDFISFSISFISKSVSLKKTLTSRISKSCRANLADHHCKVDISKYIEVREILSIDKNTIIIYKSEWADGFFDGGKLICENNISYDIISSRKSEIEIEGEIQCEIGSKITIYPACDKKFATCIRKFDNAINFRGEPFIGKDYGERY